MARVTAYLDIRHPNKNNEYLLKMHIAHKGQGTFCLWVFI